MVTNSDVRRAILSHFDEVWWEASNSPPSYITANDIGNLDSEFKPPQSESYVRLFIEFFAPTDPTLGKLIRGRGTRITRPGLITLQIFATLGDGIKRIDELSQRFIDGFQGKSIPLGDSLAPSNVAFLAGYPNDVVQDGGLWHGNAYMPFRWREVL